MKYPKIASQKEANNKRKITLISLILSIFASIASTFYALIDLNTVPSLILVSLLTIMLHIEYRYWCEGT